MLAIIVCFGAFLRLFHLGDWLHFELDQARDIKVIHAAIANGPGELPLLGPRAGGTFLRLGPGFYYLEYIGALVFGDDPRGMAMPIAALSTLSIGVFFFLMRRFFETRWALCLTTLFAVSPFLVLYGRFAWNPNPLPFFMMVGAYALLRSVDGEEPCRGRWLAASAMAFSFATHLHFLAFVSIPIIVFVFLAIKRAKFSARTWMAAIAVALVLYVPVAMNEYATGGANAKEFVASVVGKSEQSEHTLTEKLVRTVTNHAAGYWVILTGYEESAMGQFLDRGGVNFELKCDDDCHRHLLSASMAMGVLLAGVVLLVWYWRKETLPRRKDFLLLSGLWFWVCFALSIPLSYDFAPRFFLLTASFPFLFIGLIALCIRECAMAAVGERKFRVWIGSVLGVLLAVGILFSSLFSTIGRLNELRWASTREFKTPPDRILKEKARVTLETQLHSIDFMLNAYEKNHGTVFVFAEPEHKRALKYLLSARLPSDLIGSGEKAYTASNYFAVFRTDSNHVNRLKKYEMAFSVGEKKSFGALTIFRLFPKPEVAIDDRPEENGRSVDVFSTEGFAKRYTWNEWFSHREPSLIDDETDDEAL
jgi:4-amino-4-deoxy-L-arabinose transferase-like glycosyltransferase